MIKIFTRGFVHVFLVSVSTYFIAKEEYILVLISGFLISLIWCYNVKKVVYNTNLEKIVYAIGAALGSCVGLFFSKHLFCNCINTNI